MTSRQWRQLTPPQQFHEGIQGTVMYSNLLPKAGFALSTTGVALTLYKVTWMVIALFVIGGALITFSKFFPRVAIEPLSNSATHGRWRWHVTVNGFKPGGRHRR